MATLRKLSNPVPCGDSRDCLCNWDITKLRSVPRTIRKLAMNKHFWNCSILIVLSVMCVGSSTAAQDTIGTLAVTARAMGYSVCNNAEKSQEVHIPVELRLKNTSASRIILAKGPLPGDPIISKSSIDDGEGRYVYRPISSLVNGSTRDVPQFGARPSPQHFAVLEPGSGVFAFVWTAVVVRDSGGESGLVLGHQYFMRLNLETWPFWTGAKPEVLRERWKSSGYLVSKPATTELFRIDLPNPDKPIPQCEPK